MWMEKSSNKHSVFIFIYLVLFLEAELFTGGACNLPSKIFSIVKSTDLVTLRSSITVLSGMCGNT